MDIRDEAIGRIFADFKPEIVSHHAAQHSVAISARDPIYDAQVNVVGLLNVLENAARSGARKIIFASSGATFGTPERLPITDETPQRPTSPYGITKMVGEHYLRFYQDSKGLDFTALRYGNVYGPRQDPNGEAGVIAIFAAHFLAREGVRIDWDGEQTRDYVYVADVARANLAALEHGSNSCYVIGTGTRTSVNQIYDALVEVSGFRAPIERAPQRVGDARDAQFDLGASARRARLVAVDAARRRNSSDVRILSESDRHLARHKTSVALDDGALCAVGGTDRVASGEAGEDCAARRVSTQSSR